MSRELMWLTLTVILTGVLWIPYILDRIMVRGLMGAVANPSRSDKPQAPWAQRLYFAHTNAVENLVVFAPLVLILEAQGHSTESTVIACAVYFWARLAHAVIYALGGLLGTRLAHHLAGYKQALTLTFSGIVVAVGLYIVAKSIIG